MAKSKDINDAESVTAFIQKLENPLLDLVEAIRQLILRTDMRIGEQIKWNSPSFFYMGEMQPFNPKEYKRDIVVLNLHKGFPLLVFPTGAKVADNMAFLEGTYTDGRRLLTIKDMEDLKSKERQLQEVIWKWLELVDSPKED